MKYKVEKIAENEAKLTPIKEMEDIKGKKFEFYDEDNAEHHGKDRIRRHIAEAQKQRDEILDTEDKVKEIDDRIAALEEAKDMV